MGMYSFEKIIHGLSRVLNIGSGIVLAIMMGLVFINVLIRAVWKPILGAYEITSFLAALVIALAVAHCAVKKGHVAITLFADQLSQRVQAILDAIVSILGFALYTVLAWQCTKYAIVIIKSGEVSITLELPFYPFVFVIAFGILMLALVLLNDLFRSIPRIYK
jgi:TRAP-type C4-dicarboxylate transport system permease small subunit